MMDMNGRGSNSSMENISTPWDSTETAGKGRDEFGSDAVDTYDHEKPAYLQPSQSSSCQNFGPRDESRPQHVVKKLLKGKEKEWTATVEKNRPLQLLDLPLDILKDVVKEVWEDSSSIDLICAELTVLVGYPYQRSHLFGVDLLRAAQSRHSSYILALRHRLARCP